MGIINSNYNLSRRVILVRHLRLYLFLYTAVIFLSQILLLGFVLKTASLNCFNPMSQYAICWLWEMMLESE